MLIMDKRGGTFIEKSYLLLTSLLLIMSVSETFSQVGVLGVALGSVLWVAVGILFAGLPPRKEVETVNGLEKKGSLPFRILGVVLLIVGFVWMFNLLMETQVLYIRYVVVSIAFAIIIFEGMSETKKTFRTA